MLLSHSLTHQLSSSLRSLCSILIASGCGCKEATHCLTLFPVKKTACSRAGLTLKGHLDEGKPIQKQGKTRKGIVTDLEQAIGGRTQAKQ